MAIKTVITLSEDRAPAQNVAILQRADELMTAGLLAGPATRVGLTWTRQWATEEAANDWIVYINSLVPPPVSATVVVE